MSKSRDGLEKEQVNERVSALESSYRSLDEKVDAGFKELKIALRGLTEEFQTQSKPNYIVWISSMILACSLFGGLYSLISLRIENSTEPLIKALQEVETQFNSEDQLRNVQWAEQQRLNAMMWNAGPLHALTAYPTGPFYEPGITKQSQQK